MDIYECYMKEIRAFKRELMFMKVTMLSNSKGGLFTTTMSWARGLVRKGCDVNIFFLTQSKEARRLVSSEHMHFYYFMSSSFIPNLRAFVAFLAHDHPDVVHINFAWFGPLAIFKKWVSGTPFVYTLHGLPQPWLEPSLLYKIAYIVEHGLLRFVASESSAVVAVSSYIKEMLKKRYGVNSEVIYHGIDANKFKPMNKVESKRRLGYKETDFVILFVGKLHPYKDPLTLIKAFSDAIEKNSNLHLVVIGDGELYPNVDRAISELVLPNRVKLFRHVSDKELRMFYEAADLFVLTSVNEAFGMTLLEAMASGLPVITSKGGACPEIVQNAGIVFNQGDHRHLAEKIMELFHDEELSKKMAKAGLKRAKETFSWEDKIYHYFRLYKGAIYEKNE